MIRRANLKINLLLLPLLLGVLTNRQPTEVNATGIYEQTELPSLIKLSDYSDNDIRAYYSSLNALNSTELQGDNLLKNLKPILSKNQKYYNYDSGDLVWKMYEITDRDWKKSPKENIESYDASTNTISTYKYGSSSSSGDNPYVRSYYMDRSIDNPVQAWGNHKQDGAGINREHLWPKSEGFDDDKSGAGSRGDPMHLVAANGYVNNMHNNNFYGYVDKTKSYSDSKSKYSTTGHNYLGVSKTNPVAGIEVFEPQDSDKGDIARAIFYMAARYNNFANNDSTIGGANPNLALTNDLSKWQNAGYTSSETLKGYMGLVNDLLEWNKLDPVDEYELHRNNLLFSNFTNNRNPFIDFPEWADLIWGEDKTTKSANPSSDEIARPKDFVPPTDDKKTDAEKVNEIPKTYIYIGVGVGVVFLIVIILVLVKGNNKQKKALKKVAKKTYKKATKTNKRK